MPSMLNDNTPTEAIASEQATPMVAEIDNADIKSNDVKEICPQPTADNLINSNIQSQNANTTRSTVSVDTSLHAPVTSAQLEYLVQNIATIPKPDIEVLGQYLAHVMTQSPFVQHTHTVFHYENDDFVGKVDLTPELIGNTNFQILHGGVAATILDTIGGLAGMLEIYRRNQGSFEEQTKKVKRIATVDLRIDYLSPGRGHTFTAKAEVIRMGRKGCTTRMLLVNDQGKSIAHGIASYAF